MEVFQRGESPADPWVRISDFFPPLQLDIFIFLFSKGGMLRSDGHVCGAGADSLAGVYSGDTPPPTINHSSSELNRISIQTPV
jgi:hypothetical protein